MNRRHLLVFAAFTVAYLLIVFLAPPNCAGYFGLGVVFGLYVGDKNDHR